jgi:hypothetical protein
MIRRLFVLIALGGLGCATPGTGVDADRLAKEQRAAKVSEGQRLDSVKKDLAGHPDTLAFFAKGMCCQSCAIGIRIYVAGMSFVDQTRFNKGIKLNPLTQVVTVAIKGDKEVNPRALAVAVRRAGYEPVEWYRLANGKVERHALQ